MAGAAWATSHPFSVGFSGGAPAPMGNDLDFTAVIPTGGAWTAGDRDVRCLLLAPDGEPLVGSSRGSGR